MHVAELFAAHCPHLHCQIQKNLSFLVTYQKIFGQLVLRAHPIEFNENLIEQILNTLTVT